MRGLDNMRKVAALGCALVIAGMSSSLGLSSAQATSGSAHALIQGSGSTWAANAVNQWIADVQSSGLQVVYSGVGSAQGRQDFANKNVDFAVSDIGYQGTDPATGASDTSQGRGYAYLPIVAGGTSFPYQIRVGGQLVRNLRLSGETLAKIFTNKITNWDDPAITADNNGHKLPSLPIIPVVHSEGSGDSAQFTRYLATEFPSIWDPFNGGSKSFTEYFPRQGAQVAENGSDSVMNFITGGSANGAIGYDEYSYPLGAGFPVAKVLNKSGYFTLPNQYNVAVALTQAQINMDKSSPDYLLQNLDHVYVNPDRRVYPLSSYSYMIVPTGGNCGGGSSGGCDSKMTTAKRQTLADYLYYSICQGQSEMGNLGYSPLPINLVQAGFQQVAKLHTADSGVDLTKENVSTCHNPTFIPGKPKVNHLAQIAPLPPACDKEGSGPCTGAGSTGQSSSAGGGAGKSSGKSGGSSSTTSASSTNPTSSSHHPSGQSTGGGAGGGGSPTVTTGSGATAGSATVDPSTGQPVVAAGDGNTVNAAIVGSQTNVASTQSGSLRTVLAVLAAVLLIGLLVGPPILWQRLLDRRAAR